MELTESIKALSDKIDAAANAAAEKSEASEIEIKALSDKCAAMSQDIQALQQSAIAPVVEEKKTMTLADKISESADYRAFMDGRARAARIQLAAVTTPEGAVAPEAAGVIATPARLTVEALFSAANTNSNLVEFVRESAFGNKAAAVAEGGAKPESSLTFATVKAPVQVIAHWIKISRQLAADAPALAAYIQNRMADGLALKVEDQLVNGTGVDPQLSGLFAAGNYTAHGETSTSTKSVIDLIAKAIAKVQVAGYAPSAVLMNPLDWSELALTKVGSADNRYVLGDPNAADAYRIWGLPVVVSAAVPQGKFMAGDFKAAGTVYSRQGVTVELFEQDGTNVEQNLITVRAECRKALAIEAPAALVGGSLTLA